MSEKSYPIPFRSLMNWILAEREKTGEVFGVHKRWIADPAKTLPIFGEKIESPFGPAAGPNSQLAQNIIAAYVAGARFFEVKTVQSLPPVCRVPASLQTTRATIRSGPRSWRSCRRSTSMSRRGSP